MTMAPPGSSRARRIDRSRSYGRGGRFDRSDRSTVEPSPHLHGAFSCLHPTRAGRNQHESRKIVECRGRCTGRHSRREHIIDERRVSWNDRAGRGEAHRGPLVPAATGVPSPPQSGPNRVDDGEPGPPCDSRSKDRCRIDAVAKCSKGGPWHGDECGDRPGESLRHGICKRLRGSNNGPVLQRVDEPTCRSLVDEAGHTDQARSKGYLRCRTQFKPTPNAERIGRRHGASQTEHAPDRRGRVGQNS